MIQVYHITPNCLESLESFKIKFNICLTSNLEHYLHVTIYISAHLEAYL